MSDQVVVLGSGYAGSAAVKELEKSLDDEELVWVSRDRYHVVLHETQRIVRDPGVIDDVTINVNQIKGNDTRFVQGEVTKVNGEDQQVVLEGGDLIDYDYLVVALGSKTTFYGIEGLEEHAHTMKSVNDGVAIHNEVIENIKEATPDDPVKVVVGGAGLTGIETAGEVAELRDDLEAPIEIDLVEATDNIFGQGDDEVRQALREKLEDRYIGISTGDPITEVDDEALHFDSGKTEEYDVLIWTGGITGRDALHESGLDTEHNRVHTKSNLQTDDPNVFVVGDSAIIEQMYSDNPAPPTAEAAWEAAKVVGENVKREIEDQPLKNWKFHDQGTAISIGEEAIAYNVDYMPVDVFNSAPGWVLKKLIAIRWIAYLTSWPYALKTWQSM